MNWLGWSECNKLFSVGSWRFPWDIVMLWRVLEISLIAVSLRRYHTAVDLGSWESSGDLGQIKDQGALQYSVVSVSQIMTVLHHCIHTWISWRSPQAVSGCFMSCLWQIVDTSASPYLVTQYPTQCPDDMNATYVASPGASLAMTITGQSELSALAELRARNWKYI